MHQCHSARQWVSQMFRVYSEKEIRRRKNKNRKKKEEPHILFSILLLRTFLSLASAFALSSLPNRKVAVRGAASALAPVAPSAHFLRIWSRQASCKAKSRRIELPSVKQRAAKPGTYVQKHVQ